MLFHCTGVGLLNIFHFEISWMEGKINQKKKSLELDQKRGGMKGNRLNHTDK